jgi:ribosomal subunit interface protein
MTLRISGKSINVGDALRGRVSERTDEVLRKYFDGNYSGHITLSKDGFGFRTDCALHLDSGITLEADSNAADAYASAATRAGSRIARPARPMRPPRRSPR